MFFDLPDLKLKPQPAWEMQRTEWIRLAEDCLYGHAPSNTVIQGSVIAQESLWDGQGRKETVERHFQNLNERRNHADKRDERQET